VVNIDDVAWRDVGALVAKVGYDVWADDYRVIDVEGCTIDDW